MSSRSTVDNRGRKIVNKKKTKKGRGAAEEADPQLALGLQEMEVEGGAKDDLQISADSAAHEEKQAYRPQGLEWTTSAASKTGRRVQRTKTTGRMIQRTAMLSGQCVSIVIGQCGVNIKQIRKESGATVNIVDSVTKSGSRAVTVTGTLEQCHVATQMITTFAASMTKKGKQTTKKEREAEEQRKRVGGHAKMLKRKEDNVKLKDEKGDQRCSADENAETTMAEQLDAAKVPVGGGSGDEESPASNNNTLPQVHPFDNSDSTSSSISEMSSKPTEHVAGGTAMTGLGGDSSMEKKNDDASQSRTESGGRARDEPPFAILDLADTTVGAVDTASAVGGRIVAVDAIAATPGSTGGNNMTANVTAERSIHSMTDTAVADMCRMMKHAILSTGPGQLELLVEATTTFGKSNINHKLARGLMKEACTVIIALQNGGDGGVDATLADATVLAGHANDDGEGDAAFTGTGIGGAVGGFDAAAGVVGVVGVVGGTIGGIGHDERAFLLDQSIQRIADPDIVRVCLMLKHAIDSTGPEQLALLTDATTKFGISGTNHPVANGLMQAAMRKRVGNQNTPVAPAGYQPSNVDASGQGMAVVGGTGAEAGTIEATIGGITSFPPVDGVSSDTAHVEDDNTPASDQSLSPLVPSPPHIDRGMKDGEEKEEETKENEKTEETEETKATTDESEFAANAKRDAAEFLQGLSKHMFVDYLHNVSPDPTESSVVAAAVPATSFASIADGGSIVAAVAAAADTLVVPNVPASTLVSDPVDEVSRWLTMGEIIDIDGARLLIRCHDPSVKIRTPDQWIDSGQIPRRVVPFGTSENSLDAEKEKKAHDMRMAQERFKASMLEQGFSFYSCQADGNCLFRAIAHQILGDERRHVEVRQKCCDYLLANEGRFYGQWGSVDTFKAYVKSRRKPVKSATANALKGKKARETGEWGADQEYRACEGACVLSGLS